ncbi:MAG TPA: hypothetical protein VMW24_09135 [Sedimentisphaerales bacterium]|nr:hypothetical protein [Sedimentisphaerales bacterium]
MGMKKSYLFIAIGFFALAFALIGVMAMDYEPEIEQLPFAYVEIAKPPQITMQDNKIIIQPEILNPEPMPEFELPDGVVLGGEWLWDEEYQEYWYFHGDDFSRNCQDCHPESMGEEFWGCSDWNDL